MGVAIWNAFKSSIAGQALTGQGGGQGNTGPQGLLLGAIQGNTGGAAGFGPKIVDHPMTLTVGESGAELVSVTPVNNNRNSHSGELSPLAPMRSHFGGGTGILRLQAGTGGDDWLMFPPYIDYPDGQVFYAPGSGMPFVWSNGVLYEQQAGGAGWIQSMTPNGYPIDRKPGGSYSQPGGGSPTTAGAVA